MLDAVLGWQDAAGEREARLLARSAERAAEEAAKVIDGMDVVEATQAKNDAIALGESIGDALALDELVAPSVADAVDDAMASFEDPLEDAIAAPLDPTLRYADDHHDDEDPYVPDLGDWEEEDAVDGLAAPAKPRPPPPPRKKGEPKPPARRGRRDDATIRKLEERPRQAAAPAAARRGRAVGERHGHERHGRGSGGETGRDRRRGAGADRPRSASRGGRAGADVACWRRPGRR